MPKFHECTPSTDTNVVACHIFRSRLKSKHESELRDVEMEVRTLREKMSKLREDVATTEEANIVLRADIRQKGVELDEVKKVTRSLMFGIITVIHTLHYYDDT